MADLNLPGHHSIQTIQLMIWDPLAITNLPVSKCNRIVSLASPQLGFWLTGIGGIAGLKTNTPHLEAALEALKTGKGTSKTRQLDTN